MAETVVVSEFDEMADAFSAQVAPERQSDEEFGISVSGRAASFQPFPRVFRGLFDQLVGTREIVGRNIKGA